MIGGKYPIANLPFRQLYFSPTGEYQLAFRQLAKVVGNSANWRIHCGETKSLLANFILEIRQLANVVGNFANGEYSVGEIPNWRTDREPQKVYSQTF
jgi:hypothetical protein